MKMEINMAQPGTKDHPITIAPIAERVRVVWRGRTIGDSKHALELKEATYPPVVYVPRADMDMSALERTARVTTCPFKGEANYYSITSLARVSNVGGTSRPSPLAVVRLMTRSNLVGCSTGMSPGFAPRRILSTYSAARRNRSE